MGGITTCVCCGAAFEQKATGRPATMCGTCRKMRPEQRPSMGGKPKTRSCICCGKVFQVGRNSRCTFYERCSSCRDANTRKPLGKRKKKPMATYTEGALMRGTEAVHPATYDLGACDRCAYLDNGRCLMQKPGFGGTCEWFSTTMTRRPRIEPSHERR